MESFLWTVHPPHPAWTCSLASIGPRWVFLPIPCRHLCKEHRAAHLPSIVDEVKADPNAGETWGGGNLPVPSVLDAKQLIIAFSPHRTPTKQILAFFFLLIHLFVFLFFALKFTCNSSNYLGASITLEVTKAASFTLPFMPELAIAPCFTCRTLRRS